MYPRVIKLTANRRIQLLSPTLGTVERRTDDGWAVVKLLSPAYMRAILRTDDSREIAKAMIGRSHKLERPLRNPRRPATD